MRTKHAFWLMGLLAVVAGCNKGGGSVSVPATPDGMVKAVLDSLSDNQPRVVWDCLPASYQKDVEGLIHKFGAKVDGEVWDKSFVVLGKAAKLVRDKREFILNHPQMQSVAADGAKFSAALDQLLAGLEAITDSEIKTVDGLKKLDPGAYLATTGARVFKAARQISAASPEDRIGNFLAKAKGAKITVEKSEGDRATVKLESGGEPADVVNLTRVDGKWLLAEVAGSWKQMIAQADMQLDGLEMSGPQKIKGMMTLGGIEQMIDQLAGATTQEDFNARTQTIMTMLPIPFGGGMQGPRPSGPGFDANMPDDLGPDAADEFKAEIQLQADEAAEEAKQAIDEGTDAARDAIEKARDEAAKAADEALDELGK